jgi:hypothetical protein
MRRIYHLEIKTGEHFYFGSLVALYEAKKELLNISLSTLQHFNFDAEKFETENYSETLNHWLKNGLAKIEEREPTAHSCGQTIFYAVFIGDKSHLELCKGLMIHTLNLKPYINEN